MSQVVVSLDSRTYSIDIGSGNLRKLGQKIADFAPQVSSVFIVSNPKVFNLYGAAAIASVRAAQLPPPQHYLIPDGEAHKTWETLYAILTAMLEAKLDRKSVLVALGGGVIGDIAGMAASLYQRGIDFIQVPTTLLAQVDSSVGGKVAVNHPAGKNMLGAFYQPKAVLIDIETLNTLPAREISAGLAEVAKYGFIGDAEFIGWLEHNAGRLRALESEAIAYAVMVSCKAKAEIVASDEREQGRRALLNFGHTFAHAIEAGLGYGTWLHGEAVGAGMVAATQLSRRFGDVSDSDVVRVRGLIAALGCPTQLPALGAQRYWDLMALDKKNESGRTTFILLTALGRARVEKGVTYLQVEPLLA
jgi:3-dehydroquinate synthase